ncbi:hypothetical protein [uncultured Acinetobacter sp.]|uniref:hypothetical protein n=1 Tax=uncultured Acinetobacter sp. TaxID=165433 RepID=UPI002585A72A|nr:hypothetical protein [uncultured Acinetobacter sp.]
MEYPKALYRGSKEIYDTKIVNDLDQENQLREINYVSFSDLPDPVVEERSATGTGSKTHDGLVEKLAWTEDQLETAKAELITFKNDVPAMKARIAELQGDTTPLDATNDNPNPELNEETTDDAQDYDYSKWTADQLREELKKRSIKFKARDSKDELLALLNGG